MDTKNPCAYILANRRNGTLYTGVTSDLIKRIYEHRHSATEGFTKKYGVRTLVWYEQHGDMRSAIKREKQLKKFLRNAKIRLIEMKNPEWRDLWSDIIA